MGGVEAVIEQQALLLSRAGYPTYVVAGRGGQAEVFSRVQLRVIPAIDSEDPTNLVLAQALADGAPAAGFAAHCDRIEAALAEALADADVVLAHNVMTLHLNLALTVAVMRLARSSSGPRVVAWCHDLSRHVTPGRGPLRHGFPWDVLRTDYAQLHYVAVSPRRQRLLAEVLSCPAQRIAVIPNGVDPATLLGLSDRGKALVDVFSLLDADIVILMPVRVTRAKNIEFALQVTAALKAGGIEPRLVITGPPDPHASGIAAYFDELRQRRGRLALEREAVFVYDGTPEAPGPLTLTAGLVGEFYRVCDLVLMPSHREGFGLPLLEAGLVGKPIFATRVPAVEVVGPDDLQVIEANETAAGVAARILARLGQDPAWRLRRQVRREYTWPAIFRRQIEPLIGELVQEMRQAAD